VCEFKHKNEFHLLRLIAHSQRRYKVALMHSVEFPYARTDGQTEAKETSLHHALMYGFHKV
jgi:hypothetical protein